MMEHANNAGQSATIVYEASKTTHWKTLYPQKNQLLGSHNLNPGEELIAEIVGVKLQAIRDQSGSETDAVVLNFKNVAPMVLNITNARTLASLYGEAYSGWKGKSIQIYATEVKAFGKMTTGLRIRETKPAGEQEVKKYRDLLYDAKSLKELQEAFFLIPKHLKVNLIDIKDEMKATLSEGQNA